MGRTLPASKLPEHLNAKEPEGHPSLLSLLRRPVRLGGKVRKKGAHMCSPEGAHWLGREKAEESLDPVDKNRLKLGLAVLSSVNGTYCLQKPVDAPTTSGEMPEGDGGRRRDRGR